MVSPAPWPLVGAALGLALAVGLIGAGAALRGYRPALPAVVSARRLAGVVAGRPLAAVAAATGVLVVTRWVALAVGVGALIVSWRSLFGAGRAVRTEIQQLEGLALWTELLRDQIATQPALPEALVATCRRPPQALAPALSEFLGRYTHRVPLDDALRRLAEDLDDLTADRVIAALLLNAHVQGPRLTEVLSHLAAATRIEVEQRRTTGVELRRTRRATHIIVIATLTGSVLLAAAMPEWAGMFHDLPGQLALAAAVACFAAGFVLMARLSRWDTPERFITVRQGPSW